VRPRWINGERTCGETSGYWAFWPSISSNSLDLDASPFLHRQRLEPAGVGSGVIRKFFSGGFELSCNLAAWFTITAFSRREKSRVGAGGDRLAAAQSAAAG